MDAARLNISVKHVFQIAAFLVTLGVGMAGGVYGAVTWKAGIENHLTNIDNRLQQQDEKLLWIMENMQRRKITVQRPEEDQPEYQDQKIRKKPQSILHFPPLTSEAHKPMDGDSLNSLSYTYRMSR